MKSSFSDAALLLIGHGSTSNRESAAPTYQHAAELRRRGIFAEVREAFWKQEPGIRAVLLEMKSPRIFAVPLFISNGYFTQEAIPRELGLREQGQIEFPRVLRRGAQTLHYAEPVGTHPSMTNVILARAREVIERYPFPRQPKPSETALFIAGHGTSRNGNSRHAIERQVNLIRARKLYSEVQAVFIEEQPFIADCYGLAGARNFIVIPFFISDGLHSYEEIPVMLGEAERIVRQRFQNGQPTWRNPTEKHEKRVWYGRSVGTEPHLAQVILDRVGEAACFPQVPEP